MLGDMWKINICLLMVFVWNIMGSLWSSFVDFGCYFILVNVRRQMWKRNICLLMVFVWNIMCLVKFWVKRPFLESWVSISIFYSTNFCDQLSIEPISGVDSNHQQHKYCPRGHLEYSLFSLILVSFPNWLTLPNALQ